MEKDSHAHHAYFSGKRITLMGLGILGRGVGDARYLTSCGADLTITDVKSAEELRPSLVQLAQFPHIRYVLGRHEISDFETCDLVIQAAGVAEDSPYLRAARAKNIPIRMSTELFATLSDIPLIGVTGTRGKTTVTHMIHAILTAAGVSARMGGNIQGMSTLALLPDVTDISVAVLELDSWQLQGFGHVRRSPHISVFTTFYEDHLAYYGHDMERYLRDKAQIFLHQHADDICIIGAQAAPFIEKYYPDVFARSIVVSEQDVAGWNISVPGIHNRYNAACARAAAEAYGIETSLIQVALENFTGVPGRLERIREQNGIRVYNDTTAVTPDATCAALEALTGERVTLIMGGRDKGNTLDQLLSSIARHAPTVILYPGTGSEKIAAKLPSAIYTSSLHDSVQEALRITPQGGVILFSPTFSSVGAFANAYDRGDQFISILNTLWTP